MGQNPVDVGTPSSGFHKWATTEVRYHGFAGLPTARGGDGAVKSPEFTCFGHRWYLTVYPGGVQSSDDGMVSIFLHNDSNEGIKVAHCLEAKHFSGSRFARSELFLNDFRPKGAPDGKDGWGHQNFAARSKLIGSLVEGALVLEVRMKLVEGKKMHPTPFVPGNPSACKIIQDLFMDEKYADVVFEVGKQNSEDGAGKSFKTTFYAHRLILEKYSSTLAELFEDNSDPIPITDVNPGVFRHLLHYIYGGKVSDNDLNSHAKEIIDAADKYGVTNLKLEAEAFYVQSTTITVGNVLEHLLHADSKNCALLKEAAVDFIVKNKVEVLEEVSLKDVPAGIYGDVLAAMARGEGRNGNDSNTIEAKFSTMGISDLRRKVHEKGLDVDGSRETLITYLKEYP